MLLLTSCGNRKPNHVTKDGRLEGRITLSGAFAVYPLAMKWAEAFHQQHPGVRIEVDGGGAGKGMTDALTGQVELGMLSREVKNEEKQRGAIAFPVAKDAVVATVSDRNPMLQELLSHGITEKKARALWLDGTIKTWGQLLGAQNNQMVALFTRSDACGAAETWAQWIGTHQENLLGEGVNGDPGMATAVASTPLAIGMNNLGYAYDATTQQPLKGIRVVPIDINGNGTIDPEEDFYGDKLQLSAAIADGRYPTPPARNLYLIAKGVPTDPIVKAFLKYVLTDGQRLNASAGYITMSKDKRQAALQMIEK